MAVRSRLNQLDGHVLLVLVVSTHSQKDRSHATVCNPPHQLVGSTATPCHRIFYLCTGVSHHNRCTCIGITGAFGDVSFAEAAECWFIQEAASLNIVANKPAYLLLHLVVIAVLRKKGFALRWLNVQSRLKQFLYAFPIVRSH